MSEITKDDICVRDFMLFLTHELFVQLQCPACPICAQPIVAGELVHLEPLGDGRTMFSHADCYHTPEQTAV